MNKHIPIPCPFCGNVPDHNDTRLGLLAFGVTCRRCGAAGPRHQVPDDNPNDLSIAEMDSHLSQQAIRSWNKRSGEYGESLDAVHEDY